MQRLSVPNVISFLLLFSFRSPARSYPRLKSSAHATLAGLVGDLSKSHAAESRGGRDAW